MPVMLESILSGSPGGRLEYIDSGLAMSVRSSDWSGVERASGGIKSDEHASLKREW